MRGRLGVAVAPLLVLAGFLGPPAQGQDKQDPQEWKALATLPWTYVQDLSLISAQVGFAAGGNGQILKTIDGGASWSPFLNLGNPYY